MDSVLLQALFYDQQQEPLIGATVVITLNRYDQDVDDKQYIAPLELILTTDNEGRVEFSAWKNSEGVRSSIYLVKAYKSGDYTASVRRQPVVDFTFTVPDNAVDGTNVMDIATIAPFPSKSEYEVSLTLVQAEVQKAEDAASAAQAVLDEMNSRDYLLL